MAYTSGAANEAPTMAFRWQSWPLWPIEYTVWAMNYLGNMSAGMWPVSACWTHSVLPSAVLIFSPQQYNDISNRNDIPTTRTHTHAHTHTHTHTHTHDNHWPLCSCPSRTTHDMYTYLTERPNLAPTCSDRTWRVPDSSWKITERSPVITAPPKKRPGSTDKLSRSFFFCKRLTDHRAVPIRLVFHPHVRSHPLNRTETRIFSNWKWLQPSKVPSVYRFLSIGCFSLFLQMFLHL